MRSSLRSVILGLACMLLCGAITAAPQTTASARAAAKHFTAAEVTLPTAATQIPSRPDEDVSATDFRVALRRSGCFGRCPSYRVSVDGDGTVRFVGERFTAAVGEQNGRIALAAVMQLRAELRSAPFSLLDGRYTPSDPRCGSAATDMASVDITIIDRGSQRHITHYLGCANAPAALRALAQAIDDATGSARWVKPPTE